MSNLYHVLHNCRRANCDGQIIGRQTRVGRVESFSVTNTGACTQAAPVRPRDGGPVTPTRDQLYKQLKKQL